LVFKSLVIDGDAQWGSDFVLSAVALSDGPGHVEVKNSLPFPNQGLKDGSAGVYHGISAEERQDRRLVRRNIVFHPKHEALGTARLSCRLHLQSIRKNCQD
jgi:hypothetical protein